ncbi:MAG TPA: HD domain-containing phosphohydrolase [Acidimicrobiales bacterium]|nr:HD domain-containing phosphohydrolase [Acidimicrobiales bacterium]
MNLDEGLLRGADVLVVDDEPANVALVESILERNGFTRIRSTTDPRQFRSLFEAQKPDIVLLDLHMPHVGGLELLREVGSLVEPEEYLPVLMLSADVTAKARRDAFGAGATDFLTKPFDTTEVGMRVLNHLETRRIHLRLDGQRRELDELIEQKTAELEGCHLDSLKRLHNELRDETDDHTGRVATMAARLARSAGVAGELVELIERAAPLHDLGKVGVPDSVLLKPGKLSAEEFELVRTHTTLGAQIIGETTSDVLNLARIIAETHHERWNGLGYPYGLAGEAIPLPGRVVAVCDVFDALTHERPYKAAWTVDEAVRELVAERGRFFDPELVDLFVDRVLPTLSG